MTNDAMMITKIKNIYIMLLHAISKENISIVDHYLDDNLTEKFRAIIENNINNNVKQVYRQLNISDLSVLQEDENYITFEGTAKYITYFVNRKNNKFVSGDDKTRVSKSLILKFRKNTVQSKVLFKCPNCGAGLTINASSLCPYCGGSIDERFSPYVLCEIN